MWMPLGVKLKAKVGKENQADINETSMATVQLDLSSPLIFPRAYCFFWFLKVREFTYSQEESHTYSSPSFGRFCLASSPGELLILQASFSMPLLQENLPDPPDGSAHSIVYSALKVVCKR